MCFACRSFSVADIVLQAQTAVKSVQQELMPSADLSTTTVPANMAASLVPSNIAESSQVVHSCTLLCIQH